MLILGIESSCDDTAAAVVEDGSRVLSSVISSQDDIHELYGGIVPELASRRHIEMIIPVVERALKEAGVELSDIGAIGVTKGPGLVGSLLIGLSFAKALSYTLEIPYVGVNHLEAHPLAAFLTTGQGLDGDEAVPDFP
ncbi:MAG: tRNA (adenosine(37)-N6)-threonylcarbamoyltransferase complex transferase subunit TsaD, partial [Proteobacteria bacterium]|nr:tRNA (adenosine(37)-N6)-threonylcarbamoyltransferase complex transferase subunit TsaD [Pseudomonadota bacterium]